MSHKKKHRILVCPLGWGLGHTTRVIPVIKKLSGPNVEVILAGNDQQKAFYSKELPGYLFIKFPSFNVSYPRHKFLVFHLLIQIPYFLFSIIREYHQLKKIILKYSIDAVISDNRYGLFCEKKTTVFISHQISLKLPQKIKFLEKLVYKTQKYLINKFTYCWVPDMGVENSASGELSGKYPLMDNTRFVGLLSRFSNTSPKHHIGSKYDVLVILSGAESQRSIFEKQVIKNLGKSGKKILIVKGKPEANNKPISFENITILPHLGSQSLQEHIINAPVVIARSGYSSIMDLLILKKSAILVPTPGQTEQEYLAWYHQLLGNFLTLEQKKLYALNNIMEISVPKINHDYETKSEELLRNALTELKKILDT